MSKYKLKYNHICLIGLGSIGLRHLRIIKSLIPKIEITIVRSGKGKYYKEQLLATRIVDNISDALKFDYDAFFITTPSSIHYKNLTKVLKTKSHIFVEKPIFNKSKKISKILKYIKDNKIFNQVGYVFRHDNVANYYHNLIKRKVFGKIYQVNIYCGSDLTFWRKRWQIQS